MIHLIWKNGINLLGCKNKRQSLWEMIFKENLQFGSSAASDNGGGGGAYSFQSHVHGVCVYVKSIVWSSNRLSTTQITNYSPKCWGKMNSFTDFRQKACFILTGSHTQPERPTGWCLAFLLQRPDCTAHTHYTALTTCRLSVGFSFSFKKQIAPESLQQIQRFSLETFLKSLSNFSAFFLLIPTMSSCDFQGKS